MDYSFDSEVRYSDSYGPYVEYNNSVDSEPTTFNLVLTKFSALSVNFISIEAHHNSSLEQVELNWLMADHGDVKKFSIYRGTNTESMSLIATQDKSNEVIDSNVFSYVDKDELISNTYYYKVVSISNDGVSHESDVTSVKINRIDEDIVLFPNPTKSAQTIDFRAVKDSIKNLSLIDISGRVIFSTVLDQKQSLNGQITFDLSNLNAGTYILKAFAENVVLTKKLLIIK